MKTKQILQTLEDYTNLNYPITFYPEAEGGYTVLIQDLPGCISTGENLQEAMDNILDAKQQWLETAIQYQDPIPTSFQYVLIPRGKKVDNIIPQLGRREGKI